MKNLLSAIIICSSVLLGIDSASAKPLKVFILAGQSNMEGHAAVRTFDYAGMDPKTAPLLKKMRNADGTPRTCEQVWISYLTGKGTEKSGTLTAGYGALGGEAKIGPEFLFGIEMQERLGEPVLLIKTAWGGKSLHTDFRSPSAGPYILTAAQREQFTKRGTDLDAWQAEKAEATGHYYRLMMAHVQKVLANIGAVCPEYTNAEGYALAGFVWFQGWNDMVAGQEYPDRNNPDRYALYSELFAHFIRDVRKDLSAPELPFVIGVMGVGGPGKQPEFRKAMEAPALMDEFKGRVVAVQTGDFWDFDIEAAQPRQHQVNTMRDTAQEVDKVGHAVPREAGVPGWETLGRPERGDRIWRFVSFNPVNAGDIMPPGEAKRFRDVALPQGTDDWTALGFDDSEWQTGKAPIGKGSWKRGGKTVHNHSDWGDGEFLLMRTRFEIDRLDYAAYRISVLARQGFHIYLNGHKIHTYIWWKTDPYYRSIVLGENETRHLKQGTNVLAAYANTHVDTRNPEPYASIDLSIEGITEEGQVHIQAEMDRILPPKEREILRGASNAGYHYLGSAKVMAQIGEAFAQAMPVK